MSKMITQKITCPTCSNEQECSLYLSMNVTLDPLLKEKVSKNDYNNLKCEQCKSVTSIETEMMYHDMDNKIIVWCIPGGVTDDHLNQLNRGAGINFNNYFKNTLFTRNKLETFLTVSLCESNGMPQNSDEATAIQEKVRTTIELINSGKI